jgi:mannose-1-phosphate guanylyltransferase
MGEPYAVGLLRRLAHAGSERVTFLVGRDPGPFAGLASAARELGVDVDVVPEEEPLDTAGSARRLLRGTGQRSVLICNGDILTDVRYGELVQAHEARRADGTLALMRVEDPSSYGVIECDPRGRIERFLEKPEPGTTRQRTVNAGAYVLNAEVLDAFDGDDALSFERDVFPGLLDSGAALVGVEPEAHWQDLGTPERYRAGHRAVLEERCRWPWTSAMRRSGPLVAVHEDAEVCAGAALEGPVVVGSRARIEPGARVADAVLFEGTTVRSGAVVRGTVLGAGAEVAAGAVVGPDVAVADGMRVEGPAIRSGAGAPTAGAGT